MNLYPLGRSLCKGLLSPVYQYQIMGIENFPKDGGVLLCSNHISNLDPPTVGIAAPRPVHFMAKEELFSAPVLGRILPHINAFPVKRGMSDREALRKGLNLLKEEKVLGLFPEGTRSKTGELGKGLAGAGFFALRSKAHVVPCAIIGPYKAFRRVKVVFGRPIPFDDYRKNKISAEEATDIIMNEIGQLIQSYK